MNTSIKLIIAVVAVYAAVVYAGSSLGSSGKQKINDRQAKIEQILEAAK